MRINLFLKLVLKINIPWNHTIMHASARVKVWMASPISKDSIPPMNKILYLYTNRETKVNRVIHDIKPQ